MKKWLLLSVFLGWSGMALAGDFSAGVEAFKNQRYSEAFQNFLPLADEGDYRAQYYVAYLYLYGLGVNKNDQRGLSYLEESLKENYHLSQALMGYLYSQGQGVSMDKKKGIELYKKAAEQGNTSALLNLGVAYYQGDGVVRNIAKAIEYLEQISIDEKPIAGRYLGDIYLASGNDDGPARAEQAYRAAAEAGDLASYMSLGQMYMEGTGVGKNIPLALSYYKYAASAGFLPAQYTLGVLYANGTGVERNPVLAHAWLTWAANQKYEPAINALKNLKDDMTISDQDKARQEFINLQKNVINKLEPPFQKEKESAAEGEDKEPERIIFRRRRR